MPANQYSDSLLMDALRGSLSNLESLGRGAAVAPIGLLGDINALAREYVTPRLPQSVQGLLQAAPAAPTTEQILANIPRVSQPRMETSGMEQLGAAMNPRGPVDLARGAGRLAGSAVNEAMVYGRGPLASITPQPMRMVEDTGGLLAQKPAFNVAKRDASDIFGVGAERIKYTDPRSGGVIEVLAKPDGTASVLSLEVPEKFRGQGIGESLQAQVMQDFPEMMGQVSSKAAAKTAYRLGRRPPNEPNATIDDVYKLMEENSSVNLVSPEMQKRFIQESGVEDTGGLLSYRGSHTAPSPEYGAPLHDLTGGGQMYPADVYSPKAVQYYGTGNPKADREAFALANKVRGNPDAEVTMYRAVPKDESISNINAGDWVTLSKDYAKTHGESVLRGDYKILSQKVKAKDLWTNADSIQEFGYQPQGLLD